MAGLMPNCTQPVRGKNGVVYRSASEYNDYIVSRQSTVMQQVLDFVAVSERDLDSADKMLDGYVLQLDRIISEIHAMPAYRGDSALRNAAVRTFEFYRRIFGNEYKRIIAIRREGGSFTAEGMEEMERIVQEIERTEEKFDKAFHDAQLNFARRNNMQLKENEMQKEIDRLDKKYQ